MVFFATGFASPTVAAHDVRQRDDAAAAGIDVSALLQWLAEKDPSVGLRGSSGRAIKFSHGQSNPTYLIEIDGLQTRVVLRKKPAGKLLPSAHDIKREYTVMHALAKTQVPVPRMIAYCEDETVIGTEFFLMEFVEGRIFKDPNLSELRQEERGQIYAEMIRVLSLIQGADVDMLNLGSLARSRSRYLQRQVDRWTRQYQASRTGSVPSVERLSQWLADNASTADDGSTGLVHGDYRLDNLIFHPFEPRVLAVIDWELSTLGNPVADLGTALLSYRLPPDSSDIIPSFSSSVSENFLAHGIPLEHELVALYEKLARREVSSCWPVFLAFCAFRNSSILQGVYKRSLDGIASSTSADRCEDLVDKFASVGLRIADEATDIFETVLEKVKNFILNEVMPLESSFSEHVTSDKRWSVWEPMEQLKAKAKAANLWNLWIPKEIGGRFTNEEYAHMAAYMGTSVIASEVFNCSAPDTGNMELLIRFGTAEQKKKWLEPLLEGEIRSCFGMTEPEVASSDATNLQSRINIDGETVEVNGRKWWTSGAMDPRCRVCLFLGVTSPDAPKHLRQSIVLLPMDAPGVKVLRPLEVYGFDDAPHGHAEVLFENVRVRTEEALLLGEGRGFEAAQRRLGPGRIHHCMRLIGMAERALDLHMKRAVQRTTFGQKLADHGVVKSNIAASRTEIEQVRQLCLAAARVVDEAEKVQSSEKRRWIAMIKLAAPKMACEVIDRAIQAHGGMGVCQDTVLPRLWINARTLRLADGPDEVHAETIAKLELKRARL